MHYREHFRNTRQVVVREKRSFAAARSLFCLFLCVMLSFGVPVAANADVRKADVIVGSTVEERNLTVAESPSIDAERAALIDSSGTVYFERAGSDKAQIASITKVMTAIVSLDNATEDISITVSPAAAEIGESSAGLQEGDVMDLDAALKALLVPSGNDAAVALSEAVGAQMIAADSGLGSDPVQAFIDAMNKTASQIGCVDTVYTNPHGLDDGEFAGELHSTALDQVKVAKKAMEYQKIREIVGGGSTSITVKRDNKNEKVDLETTDLLLEDYSSAIGIKTGVTDLAGPSFMGAASKDGRELYAVVLDSSDEYKRFEDAKELFEWYYEHVVDFALANSSEYTTMRKNGTSTDVPVIAEVAHLDWVDRTVKATLQDPEEKISVFDLEGNISEDVEFDDVRGTVDVGDKVGKVSFYQHNKVIAVRDLVACEKVEAPNPLEALAILWQRFIGGFSGAQSQADSKVISVMPIIDNNKTNAA